MRRNHIGTRKNTFTAAVLCLLPISLVACGAADSADQNTEASESTAAAEQADAGEQSASHGMMVGETYADVCGQDGVEDAIRIWLSQTDEGSELPEHGYNVDVVNYLTAYPEEYIWLEVYQGTAEEGEKTVYAAEPVYERKISTDVEDQITVGLISRDGQDYLIEYRHDLQQGQGIYGYEIFWLDAGKQDSDRRVIEEECQYEYDLHAWETSAVDSLEQLADFGDYLSAAELERVTAALDEVFPEVTVLVRGAAEAVDIRVLCGTETETGFEIFNRGLSTWYETEEEYVEACLLEWLGTALRENPDLWETAGDGVAFRPDDAWELNFTVWDDLLGYDHVLCVYRKHYEGSRETVYNFYQEDSGILTEIASAWSYGGDCETPYPEDLDGDGKAELLICDAIYGDGGRDAIVYRTAEDGTPQEAGGTDLLDVEVEYYGIGSIYAEYLSESQTIRVYYWQDSLNDYAYKDYPLTENYDRLEWYECWFG